MANGTIREILDNALKRRAEIKEEAAALDEVIAIYRRLLRPSSRESESGSEQPELYQAPSARSAHAAYVADMLDAARRILIAEKRPLKRGDLVKRLESQGYEILGRDKNKVFGTNLWRSGKFITVPGRGYWPKDVNQSF